MPGQSVPRWRGVLRNVGKFLLWGAVGLVVLAAIGAGLIAGLCAIAR